jgi:hypothetical protein
MKKHFSAFILAGMILSFSAIARPDSNYVEFVKKEFASPDDAVLTDPQRRFIVICPDRDLGLKILARENQLYDKYQKTFRTASIWEQPAIIKIFPEHASYAAKFNSYSTLAFAAKFGKNGYTNRLIASWVQDDLIQKLLPHETAHMIIFDLAKIDEINSSQNANVLPHWVNEGLAEYFETPDDMTTFKIYIMALAFREKGNIPLDKFFAFTQYPDNTYYFYIQSELMIRFLLSRPNGSHKVRNYITTFRSKVKDGLRAFTLAFPEYSNLQALQNDLRLWTQLKVKNYKPDAAKLNQLLSKNYRTASVNDSFYKELALSAVAYQMSINGDYKNSARLAGAAVKMGNGLPLSYEAYIKSLYKLKKKNEAESSLGIYKIKNPKGAYAFIARMKEEERKYTEAVDSLLYLLNIDQGNGYFICMKIAYIYGEYLKDYEKAQQYLLKAKTYPPQLDDLY